MNAICTRGATKEKFQREAIFKETCVTWNLLSRYRDKMVVSGL